MTSERVKIATALRQTAAALRKEAEKYEERKIEKCAQVLLAARGLGALQQIIKGASHE